MFVETPTGIRILNPDERTVLNAVRDTAAAHPRSGDTAQVSARARRADPRMNRTKVARILGHLSPRLVRDLSTNGARYWRLTDEGHSSISDGRS